MIHNIHFLFRRLPGLLSQIHAVLTFLSFGALSVGIGILLLRSFEIPGLCNSLLHMKLHRVTFSQMGVRVVANKGLFKLGIWD